MRRSAQPRRDGFQDPLQLRCGLLPDVVRDLGASDGDTNLFFDVYVRTVSSPTLQRASLAPDGGQLAGGSGGARISGDGRFVVFRTLALDAAPGLTQSGGSRLFVRELATGAMARLDVPEGGDPELGIRGWAFDVSGNGRYVVFMRRWGGSCRMHSGRTVPRMEPNARISARLARAVTGSRASSCGRWKPLPYSWITKSNPTAQPTPTRTSFRGDTSSVASLYD